MVYVCLFLWVNVNEHWHLYQFGIKNNIFLHGDLQGKDLGKSWIYENISLKIKEKT